MNITTIHFHPSAELRDALLPKLLSGELSTSTIERNQEKPHEQCLSSNCG